MAKDFDALWEEWMADSNWSSPVVQSDSKPVVTPSTSFFDWDEWLASQPTSVEEDEDEDLVPQISPAPVSKTASSTISKSFSIKAFTAFMAIIILIASMCITAYMNHKVNEANTVASEILSSAEAECKDIRDTADEEASKKIAEAEAEAKKN